MSVDVLEQIKALQSTDRSRAESLALGFIRDTLDLDAVAVELRPLAVSLNSFNGFMTLADGQRLFFKTHTEADTVIGEYYHAKALADAGYPIIRPLYSSTEAGKQLLVYEVIDDPSVFDVAWAIETGKSAALPALTSAQNDADDDLFRIYERTLAWQNADEAAGQPVHQLFYHRLAGGRLARFYGDTSADVSVALPGGVASMRDIRDVRWIINGQRFETTLGELIDDALRLLNPAQAGPAIVGHGDAHNGNLFFHAGAPLVYFDPAFAGTHHPLLDLTKPLFHNVFAMWMYFPREKQVTTRLSLARDGDVWRVDHDYALPAVRQMFLRSKVERTLKPTLKLLRERGWLQANWRAALKASLLCCPLLTMNLTDAERFPPEISLLGLSMAVEMGAESVGTRSLIDRTLDEVEATLLD